MMKKLILPAMLLLIAAAGYSQRFESGMLAGFNATQVEGDSFKGYHKPGILAGIFVQTDIIPTVFTGLEIKYSQKGSRRKIKPQDPEPEVYIMRLGYMEVPLFIGFRTNDRGAVLAGISPGFLIHSAELNEYGEFPSQDQHPFNKFDLQPFLGFQFDVLDQLKIDLRFALSVVPIRGHPGDDATSYYWLNNQFNNVISLAAYYNFSR